MVAVIILRSLVIEWSMSVFMCWSLVKCLNGWMLLLFQSRPSCALQSSMTVWCAFPSNFGPSCLLVEMLTRVVQQETIMCEIWRLKIVVMASQMLVALRKGAHWLHLRQWVQRGVDLVPQFSVDSLLPLVGCHNVSCGDCLSWKPGNLRKCNVC